jgi:hypothetical protein
MSDDDKMRQLVEKYDKAKEKQPERDETPLAADVAVWELDDRPAVLICPQCAKERKGCVPKMWWVLAAKRGDTNPWWKTHCTSCAEALDAIEEEKKPKPPAVSEALELELPTEEE